MATTTTTDAGTFKRGRNAGTAKCVECGATRQRANIATVTEANGRDGVCNECFEKAGDQNAVSDGHMTCIEFQARYGEHSEYCDCIDPTSEVLPVAKPAKAIRTPKAKATAKESTVTTTTTTTIRECTTDGCTAPRIRANALKCTTHEADYRAAAKLRAIARKAAAEKAAKAAARAAKSAAK